ncbi:HEWD family protein [Halarchaeum grantii]|uniref:HEWD family protein n=1 Tax=Halarchaeum TaxID=744724 RepID=UPI00187B719D|nr:HEWD family protein [Halarchaeum grantii]
MSVNIRAPNERSCVRCGRREAWDDDVIAWRVPDGDEGEVSCIHNWDVTGEFRPVER